MKSSNGNKKKLGDMKKKPRDGAFVIYTYVTLLVATKVFSAKQ